MLAGVPSRRRMRARWTSGYAPLDPDGRGWVLYTFIVINVFKPAVPLVKDKRTGKGHDRQLENCRVRASFYWAVKA